MLKPETCEKFDLFIAEQEVRDNSKEDPCAACECWNHCWGESPWVAARQEWERSR